MGESNTIQAGTGDFRPDSGDVVLDADVSARVSTPMLEFNKQINASNGDPDFINSAARGSPFSKAKRPRLWVVASMHPCTTRKVDQPGTGHSEISQGD